MPKKGSIIYAEEEEPYSARFWKMLYNEVVI